MASYLAYVPAYSDKTHCQEVGSIDILHLDASFISNSEYPLSRNARHDRVITLLTEAGPNVELEVIRKLIAPQVTSSDSTPTSVG
nr:hypothetical protein HmN_000740200 [Hymenolepis microstoma]